jgi:hypothetical protein
MPSRASRFLLLPLMQHRNRLKVCRPAKKIGAEVLCRTPGAPLDGPQGATWRRSGRLARVAEPSTNEIDQDIGAGLTQSDRNGAAGPRIFSDENSPLSGEQAEDRCCGFWVGCGHLPPPGGLQRHRRNLGSMCHRPLLPSDQSRAEPIRDPGPDPIEEYGNAVTEAYQQKDVHPPKQPRKYPGPFGPG